MKHTACTHPATPAGRAACRKGNPAPVAPEGDVKRLARKAGLKVDAIDYTQVKSVGFETETCMRCGGSGTYPSSCWNGVCLGCSGAGVRFTRRGAAAYKKYWAYVEANNTVRADELVAGDMFLGSQRKWVRVIESKAGDFGTTRSRIGGEDQPWIETKQDWAIVTKMRDGSEMQRISTSSTSYVKRPSGENFRAAVAQVAKLAGTILTMKDADEA